ncbi:MAG: peptide deformylase [Phycisphaerales bacterium]|nr:MAG: peptide deformylase [Phycisphaerales bacterium]
MRLSEIRLDRLRIHAYPDPVLRKACAEITEFGPPLEALAGRMLELMREDRGVGLAGPQVGLLVRIFVCNATGDPKDDMVCVNPRLSDFEGGAELEEGCLSLPDVTVPVRRPEAVTIAAMGADGRPFTRRSNDLWARVWQHETDHLDARMIIDYMSTESALANQRVLKQLEQEYRRRTKRKPAGRQ